MASPKNSPNNHSDQNKIYIILVFICFIFSEVNKFFRVLDRKLLAEEESAIDEEIDPYEQLKALFSTPFMPNLLNSVVFLIRSAEEVAVLLVNYKGK